MKEYTSARVGLLLAWSVVLFFTVYGAAQVHDEISSSGLSGWRWLQQGATSLSKFGDMTGLGYIRDRVEHLRSLVHQPYLLLEPKPDPLLIAGTATESDTLAVDQLSHRIAPIKRRVLVVGASSIQFTLGVELERRLPTYERVTVKRFGKLATSLSRPDLFSWPVQIEAMAREFTPDLVIGNFGGNCVQNLPISEDEEIEFGTDAWDRLYVQRVREVIAVAQRHDADMVFIGMPNMRSRKYAERIQRLNRVQREAAEAAGALWISTWEMTSTSDGGYKTHVEWQGNRGLMRSLDGIHFRTIGARYLVDQIMAVIERHFVLTPKEPELARAERHTFESQRSGRVSYVAFIPKGADGQNRRPALYVVPSAGSRWSEWPNYPHRDLQRAAQEHGIVLVVPEERISPQMLTNEIVKDAERYLPVSNRRGLVGPDVEDLHLALDRLNIPHTFKEVDGGTFRGSLDELISWHAARLNGQVTPWHR